MKKNCIIILCLISVLLTVSCTYPSVQENDSSETTRNSAKRTKTAVQSEIVISGNDTDTEVVSSTSEDSSESESSVAEIVYTTKMSSMEISDSMEENDTRHIDEQLYNDIENAFYPVTSWGGVYSVRAENASGEIIFETDNSNERFVSASLIKLFVAGCVYERYDEVAYYEEYAGETDHLLEIMISQSDNTACNLLVTRLGGGDPAAGMDIVNGFCKLHDYPNTEMNRLMLDFNGLENYTSVSDCCRILKDYYDNTLAGSQNVIRFMHEQTVRTKIPALLDNAVVANKTGELAAVENDTAVIYTFKGDYIIAIMTNDLADTASARNAIAQASLIIYDHICGQN